MKNILKMLAVVMTVALCSQVYAQTTIGVKGGINLATINDNPYEVENLNMDWDKGYIAGVDLAVFSTINVAGPFSIQPEFHWMQKGFEFIYNKETPDNMEVERKYVYNFLELPVLARVDFGTETFGFNVYAGPSAGYALNHKYVGKNSPWVGGEDVKQGDYEEDLEWTTKDDDLGAWDNRFDFSAIAGFGVAYKTEMVHFLFDARYNHDFTDFVKYETTPDPEPDKYYHRGFSLTAGVAVPIGL